VSYRESVEPITACFLFVFVKAVSNLVFLLAIYTPVYTVQIWLYHNTGCLSSMRDHVGHVQTQLPVLAGVVSVEARNLGCSGLSKHFAEPLYVTKMVTQSN